MVDLKLAKLPDRTPVKHTVTVLPALNKRLMLYTTMYNEAHSDAEPEELAELIPYMLEAFLDGDRVFVRRLKQQERALEGKPEPHKSTPQRRPRGTESSVATN